MTPGVGRGITLILVVMVLLIAGCGDDDATTDDVGTTDDVTEAGQNPFSVGDCVDGGVPVECSAENPMPEVYSISNDGTCGEPEVQADLEEYLDGRPDLEGRIGIILSNQNTGTAACVLIDPNA